MTDGYNDTLYQPVAICRPGDWSITQNIVGRKAAFDASSVARRRCSRTENKRRLYASSLLNVTAVRQVSDRWSPKNSLSTIGREVVDGVEEHFRRAFLEGIPDSLCLFSLSRTARRWVPVWPEFETWVPHMKEPVRWLRCQNCKFAMSQMFRVRWHFAPLIVGLLKEISS